VLQALFVTGAHLHTPGIWDNIPPESLPIKELKNGGASAATIANRLITHINACMRDPKFSSPFMQTFDVISPYV
jgi:hypothetical protein